MHRIFLSLGSNLGDRRKNLQQASDLLQEQAGSITPLPRSASYREYFRISGGNRSALGVFNQDRKENIAFLAFSKHFLQKGLPVPAISSHASAGARRRASIT